MRERITGFLLQNNFLLGKWKPAITRPPGRKARPLLFLIAVLVFFMVRLQAQQKVDSLLMVASKASEDTVAIDAYRRAAVALAENDPLRGVWFALQSVQIATKKKDLLRTAQGMKVLGIAYDYRGDLDSCLFYLKQAEALFDSLDMPDWQSHTISDMAVAYHFRGNYELALRNHLAALDLRKKIGNKDFIAKSLNNIGVTYRARKDYQNAIKYYRESLVLKKELGDEQGVLNTSMNIGSVYQNQGNYDSAYQYGLLTLEYAQKLNNEEDIAGARLNIGSSLLNLGQLQKAFLFLSEAERMAIAGNYRRLILDVKEPLGDYYLLRKDFSNALSYYKSGLEIARSTQRQEHQMIFYRQLAACFKELGDFRMAFLYQDSSRQVADAMLNAENLRQINEISQVYETAEKEKQIEKLRAEKSVQTAELTRRKRERNYFILTSVLLLSLTGLAYFAYSSNKRKKDRLNRQNRIIEQALEEKEILLREIHHRVKNNLQIVSSLLALQSHFIKDEQALDAVKESRNRVYSMGLIHQNLYQEENLTEISVQEYISKLCDNLFQSYNINPGRVRLVKQIETMQLDADTLVPLGLMLNELVTNCLKYAFPGQREGTISISLSESEGKLRLRVKDDGVGLPEGFNTEAPSSFGFKMINAFIKKMKGRVLVCSKQGTSVELEISSHNKGI